MTGTSSRLCALLLAGALTTACGAADKPRAQAPAPLPPPDLSQSVVIIEADGVDPDSGGAVGSREIVDPDLHRHRRRRPANPRH